MKSVRARFTGQLGGAEEFCVNELVRETALLIERELAARKIPLQLDLDDSLPPMRGDRAMIQRVLLKLTADLFQAREANRGQQRRILLRTAAEERHIILEVRDADVEHSTEEMEQVFEPFFDAENGDRGLGLSLCRTIVEDHGGYLFALQVSGEGTCFRLKLRASNRHGHQ
jgi:signal transduction histidine kinase